MHIGQDNQGPINPKKDPGTDFHSTLPLAIYFHKKKFYFS